MVLIRQYKHPLTQAMPLALLTAALLALAGPAAGAGRDDRGFDPSGTWQGQHGPLVLMRAGDTLSFSYSAVFGATAHLCDGAGVAGLVAPGAFEYVDEQGTTRFSLGRDGLRMETTDGIASFCGAGWPGDQFTRAGFSPPERCRVSGQRALFHVVGPLPPEPRGAYVVKGDPVDALTLVNEGSVGWMLARFTGRQRSTAGLLERDALACEPPASGD